MKKIIYMISCAAILLSATGCKKFLTEKPLTQVPTSDYFKSLKDVNAAVAGVYASFQQEMMGDGTSDYGGKYHYWGDGRSDVFERSQYANNIINELSINALTSGNSTANWTGLYRTIGRANTAIKFIPQAAQYDNQVTSAVVNNNLAQCLGVRAMCYFYIVRLWGDAPIWTEPYLDVTQEAQKARSPKAAVLDTVVADLQKAYTLITKNATPVIWNMNEGAICAMLADVYMWKKDYPNAIIWVNNLFKAKGATGAVYTGTSGANLEATASWKNIFITPAASKEPIWSIHWDPLNNGCACFPIVSSKSNNPVSLDSAFHANWKKTTADIRIKWSYDTLPGLGHIDKVIKYHNITGNAMPTGATAPLPETYALYPVMYRLGDMYLLYAEALNKTGDAANALKYLNFIRVRAGLPALTAADPRVSTPAAMEDAILEERKFELFAEGKRWFDLVRTDKVKTVMDPVIKVRQRRIGTAEDGFGADLNKIMWPIHRTVLEDNKKLVQNPSYN